MNRGAVLPMSKWPCNFMQMTPKVLSDLFASHEAAYSGCLLGHHSNTGLNILSCSAMSCVEPGSTISESLPHCLAAKGLDMDLHSSSQLTKLQAGVGASLCPHLHSVHVFPFCGHGPRENCCCPLRHAGCMTAVHEREREIHYVHSASLA